MVRALPQEPPEIPRIVGGLPRLPGYKPPVRPGSCHDVANQLEVSPRHLRWVLRKLTPSHLRCKRPPDGCPAPSWGRLDVEQIRKVTDYLWGDNEVRRNLRKEMKRWNEVSPT